MTATATTLYIFFSFPPHLFCNTLDRQQFSHVMFQEKFPREMAFEGDYILYTVSPSSMSLLNMASEPQ